MPPADTPPNKSPDPQLRTVFRDRWQMLSPDQRLRLKRFFAFAALLTLAFVKPLASLIVYASGTELHSHIPLIPFVSLYLLWINRHQLPVRFATSRGWSISLTALGLTALTLAIKWPETAQLSPNDRHILPVLSFISLLAAGGFLFLGSRLMAAAAFPAAFLLFMIPLPDGVVDKVESASQAASADAAAWLFDIAKLPNNRNGNVFALPGITIKVAQECSGIRSSWVLFITGIVAANMFLKGPWRRIVFVSLVIPLGILRNGIRILVIAWLCVEVNPDMIDHWIHHRGGPIFFVLSLIPLFLILWWLRRGETRPPAGRSRPFQELTGGQCLNL